MCLRRDIWWDASECLENGLVDEIIGKENNRNPQQQPHVQAQTQSQAQSQAQARSLTRLEDKIVPKQQNPQQNQGKRQPPSEKPSSYKVGTKVISDRDGRTYIVAKNRTKARYWKLIDSI